MIVFSWTAFFFTFFKVSGVKLFKDDFMATCCYDGTVNIWQKTEKKCTLRVHENPIKAMCFIEGMGNIHRFATGGQDKQSKYIFLI